MVVRKVPKASSHATSKVMKANVSKDTNPERTLRKALLGRGLRGYRLNWRTVQGSPDIVFPKKKIAIFVNGCFWHVCPYCKKKLPKSHREYWKQKFENNIRRDKNIINDLEKESWKVIIVWECKIKKEIDKVVRNIIKVYSLR